MRNLFFIQKSHDYLLLKSGINECLNPMIIAWTPQAVDILSKENIKFCCVEELEKGSFKPEKSTTTIKNLKNWFIAMDDIIKKIVPYFNEHNINVFINSSNNIRSAIFNYYNDIAKLRILEEIYPDSKITIIDYPQNILNEVINNFKKDFDFKFSIIKNQLIKTNARKMLYPDYVSSFDITRKKGMKYFIKYLYKIMLQQFGHYPYDQISSSLLNEKKGKRILVFTSNKQTLDKLIHVLSKSKIKSVLWTDLKPILNNKIDLPLNDINFELKKFVKKYKVFSYMGIDLGNIIFNHLDKIIYHYVPLFYINHKNLILLQKRYEFDVFISPHELPLSELIMDHFSNINMPSCQLLHGSTVGVIEKRQHYQMMPERKSHFFFVYTKAIKNSLEKDVDNINNKKFRIIPTGSIYHSGINTNKTKSNESGKNYNNICYIIGPNGLLNNSCLKIGSSSECYQYKIYRMIIDTYLDFHLSNNNYLYIKCGYGIEKKSLDYFGGKIKRQNKIKFISSKKQFHKIISKMDLFFADCISSPLLELAATDKNCVFLNDKYSNEFNPYAFDMINKRFLLTDSPQEFVNYFKRSLNRKSWPDLFSGVDNDDKSMYNTFLNYSNEITPELYMSNWIKKNLFHFDSNQ